MYIFPDQPLHILCQPNLGGLVVMRFFTFQNFLAFFQKTLDNY